MTDSRPILKQYNKLLGILERFTQHKMNMDESIQVSCFINKLFSSWKYFKHTLKHLNEELTLVELGSHLGKRGIECIFVGYAENSKAFRFYVTEPNDSVSINFIIKSRDDIIDENRFSSVPRPSLRIFNGTEDIGGSVVPEEVVQQPKLELRKSKRNRTPKDFGPKFQLFLVEGTMDKVSDQHSYCFNVENDLKIFDEAMKSQDVIMMRWTLSWATILGCWLIYLQTSWLQMDLQKKTKVQVDLTKEFLSSRFSMKDMDEADVILVSTLMDTSEKLMPNNVQAVSQLEYSRMIGCLMYAMTCTRPDIVFVVGKLSKYTSNPGTQHWQAIQQVLKYLKKTIDYRLTYTGYPSVFEGYTDVSWISKTEDNSSTSGWVFLLGGALATASKEAEWLKNLLIEISLWSKPIAPICIRCDSAATLVKAYSQMYNGKSRHLGVRHSMIHKLVTNMV
nr:zinc finger, CCHC-type [Tanacetum cinerariifolium]